MKQKIGVNSVSLKEKKKQLVKTEGAQNIRKIFHLPWLASFHQYFMLKCSAWFKYTDCKEDEKF